MTPDTHPGLGKTFRFIYLNGVGARDVVAGTVTEIDAKAVTIRTDSGRIVTLNRSDILDDQEVA